MVPQISVEQEAISFGVPTRYGFPLLTDGVNPLPLGGIVGTVQNFASYLYGWTSTQSQSQYFDAVGNRRIDDSRRFKQTELDFFFQDQWRVRPNLSLNFGLRYEYKGVPYETSGLLSNIVQNSNAALPTGGFEFVVLEKGDKLYNPDNQNWAPRVGFSYSPDFSSGFMNALFGNAGRTAIRGGFGIFYDRVYGNVISNARGNAPFQQDFFVNTFGADISTIGRPAQLAPSRFGSGRNVCVSGVVPFEWK